MSVQVEARAGDGAAALTGRTALTLEPRDEQWVIQPPRGQWKAKVIKFVRTFRDPAVAIPGAILFLILVLCFFGPFIFGLPDPSVGLFTQLFEPIGSKGHLLGTNNLGNDTLSRLLHGGQVSIVVGLGATAIGFTIGTILGMTAGFFGGFVEATVMRLIDTLLAFPGLILALAIADYLGPSERSTIFAISIFGVSIYARLARSQTLGVRHRDFVTATRANGAKPRKIIFGHILPNVLPPLLAYAMITIGIAMLVEAGLSYLGLGIRPPQPSWGNMIANGEPTMGQDPALVILPSAALLITVMSLNLLADAIRRRLAFDR